MITPSFGLTATERVLPKLALDFTTASLDSRVTFTRTTDATHPATYVNSSGYITAATNDQPRFDFDSVTLACKGLLIEESRTNKFTKSENATYDWVNQSDVTNNAATGPDNTTSAQKITPKAVSASHYTDTYAAYGSTGYFSYSEYFKADGYNYSQIGLYFSGGSGTALFNLSNGTVATSSNATASISPAANGFYRCTIVVNVTSTASPVQRFQIFSAPGSSTFTGDGTSGVLRYGRQLEAGAFATSYIPTTTAAMTRNADVATMTGTNFSDWFNASEGTFIVQNLFGRSIGSSQFPTHFYVGDGTGNNKLLAFAYSSSGNKNNFTGITSGVSQWSLDGSGTVVSKDAAVKLCTSYKINAISMAVNGNSVLTDTTASIPSVNVMQLGNQLLSSYLNGWLQKFYYYPQNFTSAETTAFSK